MTGTKRALARPASLASALGIALALSSCGGGSSAGSGNSVAVAPAPTPSPTPTPTPTPTPSSTLTQRLGSGPLLEVLRDGDVIGGPLVCADGGVYATQPDGTIRLASITGQLQSNFDNSLNIRSRGTDHYSFDINGFGGSTFTPTDKRESGARLLTEFRKSDDQLQIANPLSFATLGFLANGNTGFCFFAAGPSLRAPDNTRLTLASGLIDGIARISDTTYRLYASPLTATWNAAERSADVEVMLEGRDPAFGALDSTTPIALGLLRLRTAGGIPSITLQSAAVEGFFDCTYFVSGGGLGCTFDLKTAAGDRIVGALAADARSI